MNKYLLFSLSLLLLIACNTGRQAELLQGHIADLKTEFVPDKRVKLFEVEAEEKQGKVLLTGKTTLPELKQRLLSFASQNGVEVIDSIRVLPQGELEKTPFGVVNLSVANLRSQPRHSAELSTQALMGTVLRVWDKDGDFYLVQTPDDYFGWMDDGGFVLLDSSGLADYLSSERWMVAQSYAFVFQEPSVASQKVTDLVAGDILSGQTTGTGTLSPQAFISVSLPDGRTGYVLKADVQPFSAWLNRPEPTAADIIATGLEMMGRPYLWGGTSGKGMDCSGFTKMAYFLNGLQLPRDASQQVHCGELLEKDTTLASYRPADLLFFGREATAEQTERIWHVALYLGDGKILHASDRVRIQSLRRNDPDFAEDRLKTLVRGRRVLGASSVPRVKELPWYTAGQQSLRR